MHNLSVGNEILKIYFELLLIEFTVALPIPWATARKVSVSDMQLAADEIT